MRGWRVADIDRFLDRHVSRSVLGAAGRKRQPGGAAGH